MSISLHALMTLLAEKKGSDLFITAGSTPCIKLAGVVRQIGQEVVDSDQVRQLVYGTMSESQIEEFEREKELNFAVTSEDGYRFRANAFVQRGNVGMVLRRIETKIPTVEELNIPSILNEFAMLKRGIVIMVGATGTGKSTTLAAMVGHRNKNSSGHIVTIEDPIEFLHEHDGCLVTQREVGVDTESWDAALKNTLRQAPNVILIGEIRSRETMQHAITFAETGHLVMCTLHANNANQALDRIHHFFPEDGRDQLWMDLSLNMRAIVAQQLIPSTDGRNLIPAVEILVNTPLVTDMIRKQEIHTIKEVMTKSAEQGMQTFDQALFELYESEQISYENALLYADSKNDLRLMIKFREEKARSSMLEGQDTPDKSTLEMEESEFSRLGKHYES